MENYRSPAEDFKALLSEEPLEAPKEQTGPKVPPEVLNAPEVPQTAVEEALDTTESTLAPSATERAILKHVLEGISVDSISYNLGIPIGSVRAFLRKPKVKEYLRELREAAAEIDHMMLTSLTRDIISQRVEEAEGNMASLTKKDTLDVIKLFSDITNQTLKGVQEDKEQDVFVNIYNQILN